MAAFQHHMKLSFIFCVFLVQSLILKQGVSVNGGGITSKFVRKVEKAIDMPLDSDVFSVPPGFNAPQQVHSFSPFINKLCKSYCVDKNQSLCKNACRDKTV